MQPQYYSEAVLAILIATLVSLVLWRRQRKQRTTVGVARMTIVFVVAALVSLVFLLAPVSLARQAGLEPGKWSQQAIQVTSAVIAYLVAGQVLARFRKRAS